MWLYHFLKKEYPELPLPSEDGAALFGDEKRCRFFEMMRNLYWFDEHLAGNSETPAAFDYPQSQVFIRSRSGYHFACKGGHNDEAHNHNDVGSFILIHNREYVLDDPGWPEYDKWYFGGKRYTDYICAMSQGHSLPIINGQGQKAGAEYAGKLLSSSGDEITIDLSGAYGIVVRAGLQCAPLIHRAMGTDDRGVVRASVSDMNTAGDIDRLIGAVSEIAEAAK